MNENHSRKYRILLSTFTFYPARNGVANSIFKFAEGLAKKGHEIIVTTSKINQKLGEIRNYDYLKSIGITVMEFEIKRVRHRKYSGEIEKYQNFLRQADCDVIITYGFPNWNTDLLLSVKNEIASKVILESRGYSGNVIYSWKHLKTWLIWRPYHWKLLDVLKMADHLVFLSNIPDNDRFYDLSLAVKYNLNYTAIANGSELIGCNVKSNDFRHKYNIKTKHIILNVSGYSVLKNPFSSLKAFHKSRVEDTTLVICGLRKDDYDMVLRKYIAKNNVNNVLLLENLSDEDVHNAYLSADLFLCTSKTESFGLVVLDAICCGVPFISTLKIMNRFKGGIVVKNEKQMANQISYLIKNEGARKNLIQQCTPEYLDNFRWGSLINEYEQMIASVIEK